MIIHFNNTEVEVIENDNSYRYRAIMGEHSLTLHFSMPEFIEIPVGAYCEFQGQTYTLEKPENFKKNGSREFEYTIIMDSAQTKLGKYKLRNTVDRRLKFSYTAKPKEHLQLLVDNLNQRDSGWSVGEYVDSVEKTISYNHTYCNESLQMMADEFNTEWEVVEKTIHLRKVEYNKDNPLPMSYGRGNGFLPGVGRSNFNDSRPVEILFVQGGEKNIDRSKYGSAELLLPKSQKFEYEGRTYITDAEGLSIRRFDKPIIFNNEDSLDCAEIYPKRVGSISSVIVVNADKNFYDIVDTSIPDNLNFEDCLIEGETMTIIFQSGMLAGKEFEVKYVHKRTTINGVTKVGKRFEIVPQDIDGQTMPNATFAPRPEDKYAVFNCMLPEAYICDNATKTGGSWDMYREGVKYLYENEDQRFSFTGEMDGIWSKKDWLNIGGKIKLGSYVLFSDNQFQQDGILIRMVGIKDYIYNPHSPIIELSNVTVGGSVSSDLQKITANEVVVEDKYNDALKFTKRRFRDSIETIEMLGNALLDNFTNSINPITVQTMSMLVGDESLQFRFVDSATSGATVSHNVVYDNITKQLTSPAGTIQHMTLGIASLSSSHELSEYKFWNITEYTSAKLLDGKKKYYLYAKVSIDGNTGEFILSETAIKMRNGTDYYHLLLGVLNSEFDGERSFVDLYGYTEVLPGRITTDRVVSADGMNFLDFINNAFRVGNMTTFIDFNSRGDGKLRIRGTLIQSESGDESFIGVFRGSYSSTNTYYAGDEVTYTANGGTSTYRYIHQTPSRGTTPTTSSHWQIIASSGSNGDFYEYRYAVNGSRTAPPSLEANTPTPSGWSTSMPTVGSLQYLWCTVAKKKADGTLITSWSTPTRITGADGRDGAPGASVVFRGLYNSSAVYYGNATRVDVVKYNSVYYIARIDAGTFTNKVPTDTSKWNDFGAQFDSVATNLLLAENANIGDWYMSGGKIVSTLSSGRKISLDASMSRIFIESPGTGGDWSLDYGASSIDLDASSGDITARNKNGVAYLSASGVFCNNPKTNALPASSGFTHYGAMVGLGYASNINYNWDFGSPDTIVSGVYGRASNSGNAPSYGGFFYDLMAAGMVLSKKYISDSSNYYDCQLNQSVSFVLGLTNSGVTKDVYLPNDGYEGRIIFAKQIGVGQMRFRPMSGMYIHDDSTQNDYYDIPEGWMAVFVCVRFLLNGVSRKVWTVSRFRF